jgi:branched-chain amino acid transport system ATP-binding protein
VLDVSSLTVQFGGVTSLADVNLRFTDGVCGLIGPNGAGKTTLLNVLSGFVRPRAGSVKLGDVSLLDMRPARRARWGIRRTFQQDEVVDELSVRDNLQVAATRAPGSTPRWTVDDILAVTGLAPFAGEAATTLSTFERRLLEIGRAAVGSPRVLLFDEPAAGVGPDETARVSELIRIIHRHSRALVIVVEHDMDFVRAMCESLAVLDFGHVIANGPTETVLADPHVVGAYLGRDPLK